MNLRIAHFACISGAIWLAACSRLHDLPEDYAETEAPSADTLIIYSPERRLPSDFIPLPADTPWVDTFHVLQVSVAKQQMTLYELGRPVQTFRISTSMVGTGSRMGSIRTPLGRHRICRMVGDGLVAGAVLRGAKPTGEVAQIFIDTTNVEDDLVTTRILWLEGLEPGRNRGGLVDSYHRYIYIHGTPEEGLIGQPASHGCLRMYNRDVIALYNRIRLGSLVIIEP